jgi:hypothetical protein
LAKTHVASTGEGEVKAVAQVSRVNAVVDPQTQMVKIYLNLRGKEIREGQYFKFQAQGKTITKSMRLPRLWINDRKRIFAVKPQDSTLYEVSVNIESLEKDHAIVTGFEEGLWLVQRSIAGAFEGMKVVPQLPKKGE